VLGRGFVGFAILAICLSMSWGAIQVEYKLTRLGMSLGAAFCGVWVWAAENLEQVERARDMFDKRGATD
jgi:DNA-binding HxlR family transcriptional regulator